MKNVKYNSIFVSPRLINNNLKCREKKEKKKGFIFLHCSFKINIFDIMSHLS